VRKEVGGAAVNELGLEEGEGVERSPARWGGQGGGQGGGAWDFEFPGL